jgi:hypothetical protein
MKPSAIEMLTGTIICPKCHDVVGRNDAEHGQRQLKAHLAICDGQKHAKLNLGRRCVPYVPHLLKNKEYGLSIVKKLPYEPIREYFCFDFETVYTKFAGPPTEKGQTILADLDPLSVATVLRAKDYSRCTYHDSREEDWLNKWVLELFHMAEEILPSGEGVVRVLGWNSNKFDIQLILPYLHRDDGYWKIKIIIGTPSKPKRIDVLCDGIVLQFIDAMNLVCKMTLEEFIQKFHGEVHKGVFPYEAFDSFNYNEVLSKAEPFLPEDFYSTLRRRNLMDDPKEYQQYLECAKGFPTRWDYLRYYNEIDVKSMLIPIERLIDLNWEYNIDTLTNVSLSANASAIKYALAYRGFDVDKDYNKPDPAVDPFEFTRDWWQMKCASYLKQDREAKRATDENVTGADFQHFQKKFRKNPTCYMCHGKFNAKRQPGLDRIDNAIGHSRKNVLFACKGCNRFRGNRDVDTSRLHIQVEKFAWKNYLPMTLSKQQPEWDTIYQILRKGITGGLANVMHRINIKGLTHINKFHYNSSEQKIYDEDTEHIMTHLCGLDFNSLYPSAFSSNYSKNIPYTGGRMFMPGRVFKFMCNATSTQQEMINIIKSQDRFEAYGQMFIAEVRGFIDEDYLEEFVNFPPIFRRVKYEITRERIGDYMYDYMFEHGFVKERKTPRTEEKLTMLLSTHGEFMSFSSYYLWFLIDRCHFIIEEVRTLTLFTKHMAFNPFVNEFMKKRLDNPENQEFYKISMNGSYGYDGMNTEKFTKTKIVSAAEGLLMQQHPDFVSSRKLSEKFYMVTYHPRSFRCDKCIHESYFTLDNAKYWYLNFVYNFMHKCLDMNRCHFIEGDTDSAYWAIAGDPSKGYKQGFSCIVKNQRFYDRHVFDWFPDTTIEDPIQRKYNEKKLLGLAIEKEGEYCIALSPKCYTIWRDEEAVVAMKVKGYNQKSGALTIQNYRDALSEIFTGTNIQLGMKNNKMTMYQVVKNALTGMHTKMVVQENGACLPFDPYSAL